MHISTLLIKFIGITKFLQVFREVSCTQKPMKVATYPRKPNYMYLHKIQHNVFRGVQPRQTVLVVEFKVQKGCNIPRKIKKI